jgi:nicotinate-nucleotide--dimethylbenzimidazole phosphoribosyltransferase
VIGRARGTGPLAELVKAVIPLETEHVAPIRHRLDSLTKPRGSLGRLEDLAVQLTQIYGAPPPSLERRAVIVMVADHGVAARGVSAYPLAVTAQMCHNFAAGGAAICVMAPAAGASVYVVDVGVDADLSELEGIHHRKVRRASRDLSRERALTLSEVRRAILTGAEFVANLQPFPDVIAIGEMGIGNTTAAAALAAAITGADPARVAGRGTGISDEALAFKIALIERALARIPRGAGALRILGEVGGIEIAALVGVILGAARARRAVIIDGFIASAAALTCVRLCSAASAYLVASHLSPEPGHQVVLAALGLKPYLDLEMRLGEGTGALLAFPIVDAAGRILRMATFASAGVSTASDHTAL